MTVYSRGDVIWANLEPVRSGEQGKTRPCVIVSNDAMNHSKHPCIIVCPIAGHETSPKIYSTHVLLAKEEMPGLEKDSVVMTEQIRTIAKSRIVETRLKIAETKMAEVEKALKIAVDLF